jgi:hypothetical protein
MARNPRHAALYELINKARFKNAQQKALARIGVKTDSVKPQEERPVVVSQVEPIVAPVVQAQPAQTEQVKAAKPEPVKTIVAWSAKPKPFRVYPDRIELCIPWQTAAITVLAFVAVLLVFFRLGQIYAIKKVPETKVSKAVVPVQAVIPEPVKQPVAEKKVTPQTPPKMVEPMGDNIIVITSYDVSSHLEPVKQYFATYGIATEIIKRGSRYLLVTQNRFNSIDKPGTDGYEMKKKIISVGANYKPPAGSGFESFGTKPFQDVYAMKAN